MYMYVHIYQTFYTDLDKGILSPVFPCFGVLEIFIEDFKNLPQNKSVLQMYPDDKAPIASDALLGTGAFLMEISHEEHKH